MAEADATDAADAADADGGEVWSHETRGAVGVWRIHDVRALFDGELVAAERHFVEAAGDHRVDGVVVAFDGPGYLDEEMCAHVEREWSRLGRAVDVDRVAYVDDGIRSWTAKLTVSLPATAVETFETLPAAVEWAGAGGGAGAGGR